MRIRKPFAGAFVALTLVAAYLGLAPIKLPSYRQSDKALHFLTFFLLTGTFYWILDASRRRVLHLTLMVCTVGLAIGSEVLQGILPNGRDFDIFDIVANSVGSLAALGACAWYHQRVLERKRANKGYTSVGQGDEETGDAGLPDPDDMELDEGTGGQESGVTAGATNIDEELDQWDENAPDEWDDNEDDAEHDKQQDTAKKTAN